MVYGRWFNYIYQKNHRIQPLLIALDPEVPRDHNSHSTLPTGPHRDAREVRSYDPQAPQGL